MATYYVDPQNGDNGTGDGSIGTPWATTQYAIDNGTWSTTVPNSLKIANTAAEVFTASLTLTGLTNVEYPFLFEGYDAGGSLTGDGPFGTTIDVVGEWDGDNAISTFHAYQGLVSYKNMKMHGVTSNFNRTAGGIMINCDVSDIGTSNGPRGYTCVTNSRIDGSTSRYGTIYQCADVSHCEVIGGELGISMNASTSTVENNLIRGQSGQSGRQGRAVYIDDSAIFRNNTLDGTGGDSDLVGVIIDQFQESVQVYNNVFANFSGGTATALESQTGANMVIYGNNSYYNNTTDTDIVAAPATTLPDFSETSDPFTDRAGGDYSITSGALSVGASLFTNADPSNPNDLGAVQVQTQPAGNSPTKVNRGSQSGGSAW